jgi:hypothetical protein
MLRRIFSCAAVVTLVGSGLALWSAAPASSGPMPAAISVDTTDDDGSMEACTAAPDDCSLRGALEGYANANHVNGQTIDVTVPAGTYALLDEIRLFQANVDVHGAGVDQTIVTIDDSEDSTIRHLELSPDGELIVALSDMTFRDGLSSGGGSIRAQGGVHLEVARMHFLDNEARGSGGAIAFYGNPANFTLIVDDSTFAGNIASQLGGAIHLDQGETAEITNSTFTGNVADLGGAIFVGNEGGVPTDATLTHVTLADNGLSNPEGTNEGGAIGVGDNGSVTIDGVVIERSTEMEGGLVPQALGDPVANCWVFGEGAIVSEGHNVSDDDSCVLDQDTDQPDTAADTQALADNGGPTHTMALLVDSPAVDAAGDTCAVDADQRGEARPQDGDNDGTVACDSGAYELPGEEPAEPPAALPAEETPNFTG